MMAVDNQDYAIAPAVELNLRNTMGHVCLSLYDRYIERGAVGRFAITLLHANIEANVVCAVLEQTCEGNGHAQQWWHSLREMSAERYALQGRTVFAAE